MIDVWSPLPSSVLAFVTTVHAAMLVVRKHRSPRSHALYLLLAPPAAFAAAPWLFPSLAAVGAGLAVHVIWFLVCERVTPAPPAVVSAPTRVALATAAPRSSSTTAARPAGDRFTLAPVVAVIEESPDVRTFRLARPNEFRFEAGQFVTVRVQADGRPHTRCYSISSAPEATSYIEISVKRQGLVSSTLHATVRPGSSLAVGPPAGKFVYPTGDDRPIVLIAGGIGITPLMSMLRHAVAADPLRPITLLYSARTPHDVVFGDELEVIARRHPHVRVALTLTGPEATSCGRAGRIDSAFVREHVAIIDHAIYFVCGPQPMIRAMRPLLVGLSVPDAQIRSEAFQAATGAAGAVMPAQSSTGPPPVRGDLVTVRFVQSGKEAPSARERTLLEAAEDVGIPLPSLCRAGVCGTCRTRLIDGEVRCTSALAESRDGRLEWVLPCVTWPQGDCAIEA